MNTMLPELTFQPDLDAIIETLLTEKRPPASLGYKRGSLGSALFYLLNDRFESDRHMAKHADEFIMKSVVRINNGQYEGDTLARDLAEIGTFFEYVRAHNLMELDYSEIADVIDQYQLTFLKSRIGQADFDPYTGSLISGHYFLHRYGSNPSLSQPALEQIADGLLTTAVAGPNGLHWPSKLFNDDRIYLGLSHGLAAIVLYFCRLIEIGIRPLEARNAIEGAVRYIRANAWDASKHGCYFPNVVGEAPAQTRLGLCYGDMGVAYALYRAGTTLADGELTAYATRVFEHTLTRTDPVTSGIRDAGILYGAAGVALIYQKMFCLTQDQRYERATEFWAHQLTSFRIEAPETAGYVSHFNTAVWYTNLSFMEGIAGIGAAMMVLSSDEVPPLDELIWLF